MHLRGFWLKKTHYNKFDSRICFIMSKYILRTKYIVYVL